MQCPPKTTYAHAAARDSVDPNPLSIRTVACRRKFALGFDAVCGLRTAAAVAAVACAEGIGAKLAAGRRLDNKFEGLVGLKAHVVVANWALDVAGYFASASSYSSYAR